MKRRGFLIGLGAVAAGGWLLRPENRGQPHDDYFQAINDHLRNAGPGRPLMLVDRQRLATNCRALMAMIPGTCQYRIVAKSLPSVALIRDVMTHTGSNRVMVFHQPFMNALAEAEPGVDMLLGKPMPIQAAKQFYTELGNDSSFDADTPPAMADRLPRPPDPVSGAGPGHWGAASISISRLMWACTGAALPIRRNWTS